MENTILEPQNEWCEGGRNLEEISKFIVLLEDATRCDKKSFQNMVLEEPLVKTFLFGAEMCITKAIQIRIQCLIADIQEAMQVCARLEKSHLIKCETLDRQLLSLLKKFEEDNPTQWKQIMAIQSASRECKKHWAEMKVLSIMERRNVEICHTVYNALVQMLKGLPFYDATLYTNSER